MSGACRRLFVDLPRPEHPKLLGVPNWRASASLLPRVTKISTTPIRQNRSLYDNAGAAPGEVLIPATDNHNRRRSAAA